MYGKEDVESMTAGFRVREQKFICGKDYATADTMQVDFFEITEQQHKASTRKKKELAPPDRLPIFWRLESVYRLRLQR